MYATSDGQMDDGRRWPPNAPPLRGGGIIKTVKEDELNDATDQWTGDVDYQRRRQRRTFCSSPTARPVNFSREFCRYFKRFYEEKLHHSCEKALFSDTYIYILYLPRFGE